MFSDIPGFESLRLRQFLQTAHRHGGCFPLNLTNSGFHMGFFDLFKPEPNAKRNVAKNIALRMGVLEECPVCRDIKDPMRPANLEKALQFAEVLMARGDPSVEVFEGDVEALKAAIREAQERASIDCSCTLV